MVAYSADLGIRTKPCMQPLACDKAPNSDRQINAFATSKLILYARLSRTPQAEQRIVVIHQWPSWPGLPPWQKPAIRLSRSQTRSIATTADSKRSDGLTLITRREGHNATRDVTQSLTRPCHPRARHLLLKPQHNSMRTVTPSCLEFIFFPIGFRIRNIGH